MKHAEAQATPQTSLTSSFALVFGVGLAMAVPAATVAANAAKNAADPVSLPGPGWRFVGLPQQKPPPTRYSATLLDGRPALRIDAQASYGNWLHALNGPAPASLAWSWRVDLPNPAADLRTRAGDDTAVKVCLSFDLPLEQVPFFERELLRLARTRSPEPLPAATLCWVWGTAEARGSVLPNPFSRRVRYIVLRGTADGTGRWLDEQRDVAADWALAFGDESAQVPPVTAVAVAGDADNTGGRSVAFVSGLRLQR